MAVADPRVMAFSNLNAGLVEAFSYVANRRLHTIAFLGAAQIDRYGNMNSTVIGDYLAPKVRFSGSGGACDAGSLASGYIVFMQHGVQKFVEKLDYLTTPGWLERRRLAPPRRLPARRPHRRGHQPLRAQVRRGDRTRCTWPSATRASRRSRCSRTPASRSTSRAAVVAEPPTAEELRILRDDVDPQRLILG